MLKKERHNFILAELNNHKKVVSAQLSAQLGTSEDTIRRDLNELAATGCLLKVHGGALSPPVARQEDTPQLDNTEKMAITLVQQALQLLLKGKLSQTINVMIFSVDTPADK
ncbi:MAG: DeoR family transcriptional regulator [Bacteroidota bacterium]